MKTKKSVHVRILKKSDLSRLQVDRERDVLNRNDQNANVVSLYDMEEKDDYYYIAYERCSMSLCHYVRSNDWNYDDVKKILKSSLEGLNYLHGFDIHRNIRPSNILISEEKRIISGKISNLLSSKYLQKGCLFQSVSQDFEGNVSFQFQDMYDNQRL